MSRLIYVKLKQKTELSREVVKISDVAELFSEEQSQIYVAGNAVIGHVGPTCRKLPVSGLLLIQVLQKKLPGVDFFLMGAEDCLVTYRVPGRWDLILSVGKAALVSILMFFGAAFAIMTFNEDVGVPSLFESFYEIVMKQPSSGNTVLEWSYSLGLPLGIFLFYNHFFGRKLTEDPTPLQVEMNDYEKKVDQTIIELEAAKEKKV